MIPPYEDLPVFLQIILTFSSILILVLGGAIFYRMLRTLFGKKRSE